MSNVIRDKREDQLDEAQELGLEGYYDAAFSILDSLLAKHGVDIAALRLQGNLLELKAMEALELSRKNFSTSVDYLTARSCYEKILQVDPQNARAWIDLGDHYRNFDAKDKALECYKNAMTALRQAPSQPAFREDVKELLDAVTVLSKNARLADEANAIQEWCAEVLIAA